MNSPSSNPIHQIQVAVPVPLRQLFDYLYDQPIDPGTRVVVPFGRRKLIGIVISNENTELGFKLRCIESVIDQDVVINPKMLRLLRWASTYYHHPLGEVLHRALPGTLRSNVTIFDPDIQTVYLANSDPADEDVKANLKRSPKQNIIYQYFKKNQNSEFSLADLKSYAPELNSPGFNNQLKSLIEKKLIISKQIRFDAAFNINVPFKKNLNSEQIQAVNNVVTSLNSFKSFVLHGITGSGKTEVYLHIVEQCIAKGQQALILVPEISLTPQLVGRFKSRFGEGVATIHSAMPDHLRYQSWWRGRNGTASVVLGTRSAIFTPLKNPGVIVVDEEHDISFKQQEGFRYHARDLAIKRASLSDIPIILGSATPSMESIHNAKLGRHQLLALNRRIGSATLPGMQLIDLKNGPKHEGISPALMDCIGQELKKGQQTILYINRRGFAPIAQCTSCGWQAKCDRCDAFLTFHQKTRTYRCHHCSKKAKAELDCPQCQQALLFSGYGTQRIERAIVKQFPQARVCRFDRDEVNTQKKLQQTLNLINSGDVDIIIGTRLISKGHDFPLVTLVGIIAPDQGLYSTDFRAPEYLYQQLVQVAGRAGRSKSPGRVMIQTSHPDNTYLQLIQNYQFEAFYKHCSDERQQAGFPPFGYIALWRAESTRALAGLDFLGFVSQQGRSLINTNSIVGVTIMDPVSSPMEKRAGKFRAQLLVMASDRKPMHDLIANWLSAIEDSAESRKVRWSIDIDPIEIY